MDEKKVRGSILKGFLTYIKRTWGGDGIEDFKEKYDIDPDGIKGGRWYNSFYLSAIHEWIAEEKDIDYLRRAGKYTIQDLGILSYLIKFANVKRLLKKAPKSYRDAFNYGECTIDVGEKEAIVKMKNVVIDKYTCTAWKGVFEGTLAATNTNGVVETLESDDKGENDCFYKITWE